MGEKYLIPKMCNNITAIFGAFPSIVPIFSKILLLIFIDKFPFNPIRVKQKLTVSFCAIGIG
jgi:hypothetical protein